MAELDPYIGFHYLERKRVNRRVWDLVRKCGQPKDLFCSFVVLIPQNKECLQRYHTAQYSMSLGGLYPPESLQPYIISNITHLDGVLFS